MDTNQAVHFFILESYSFHTVLLDQSYPAFTCSKLTMKTPKQCGNMFQGNNEDTRMTSLALFWCLYC